MTFLTPCRVCGSMFRRIRKEIYCSDPCRQSVKYTKKGRACAAAGRDHGLTAGARLLEPSTPCMGPGRHAGGSAG